MEPKLKKNSKKTIIIIAAVALAIFVVGCFLKLCYTEKKYCNRGEPI